MKRIYSYLSTKPVYLLIGIINIIIFHYSIIRLFIFLYQTPQVIGKADFLGALFVDTLLLLFFCIPHSLLLHAKAKQLFYQYIPKSLYPTIYSLHASIGIILMEKYWMSFGMDFYSLSGSAKLVMNGCYIFAWIFMFWSMWTTGLFSQNGIKEWWLGLRGKNLKGTLLTHGAYGLCRHPIYASFMAMIWFTPNMTYDHLFLSIAWTAYILIGAAFKERRLSRNKLYQKYSHEVPAFPFIPLSWDAFFTRKIWRQV